MSQVHHRHGIQGKYIGWGRRTAAAADYAIATVHADIKLNWPSASVPLWSVRPLNQDRGFGIQTLSIDASMWRNSEWAKKKDCSLRSMRISKYG